MANEARRADDVVTPREFGARIDEVQRSVDSVRMSGAKVDLREYIEALLGEGQRATEKAERERDRAAEALAVQLAQQIEQGDHALRDHIEQQIQQLQIMLESTRRETDIRTAEQQKAISKAEAANERRFEAINELRGQMADLIGGHQRSLNALTSTLMPREVAEAKFEDLANKIGANRSRLDRATGIGESDTAHRGRTQWATTTVIALGVALISIITVIATLATHLSVH